MTYLTGKDAKNFINRMEEAENNRLPDEEKKRINDNYKLIMSKSDERSIEKYLIKVGIRSLEFTYTDDIIFDNIDYFKRCKEQGLSEYKALLFFNDYLKGEYEI